MRCDAEWRATRSRDRDVPVNRSAKSREADEESDDESNHHVKTGNQMGSIVRRTYPCQAQSARNTGLNPRLFKV
jgi:hypothetical protein